MKKKIKWCVMAIILIAAVAAGIYYMSKPLAVELFLVEPADVSFSFSEQGFVKEQDSLTLYAQASGEIISLTVEEGQFVPAGTVICTVNTSDLEYQIQQTQANIRSYEAQILNLDEEDRKQKDNLIANKNSLQNELDALSAQQFNTTISIEEQLRLQQIIIEQRTQELSVAQENLDRAETLYNSGVLPKSDYEAAENAVTSSRNQLDESIQQLEVIETGVTQGVDYYEAMKSSLLAQIEGIEHTTGQNYTEAMKRYYLSLIEADRISIAQLNQNIQNASVITPIDGFIHLLPAKNTNLIFQNNPVAVILPVSSYNPIETYVSTKNIDDIKTGMEVDLLFPRQKEDIVFKGVVHEIDNKAETMTSVLGIDERKVKVTIVPLENNDSYFKAGYDADVVFTTYVENHKLSVPKTAIFQIEGQDMVWLCTDEKLALAPIEKGLELRTLFVVEEGLNPQDLIVKDANQDGLKEGKNVIHDQ